jgi:CPA2 family monovalent cation:H+ antiporter-2
MIITPTLLNRADWIAERFFPAPNRTESVPEQQHAEAAHQHHDLTNHVIICGYGRVGQIVARFLKQMGIQYVAIDPDPIRIKEASSAGEPAYYGDAKRVDILRGLGAADARLIILTLPNPKSSLEALKHIKREFGEIPVLVRTQDDYHLEQFQIYGAAEVVPEALEGSLMLVSHVLTLLEVPADVIKERIHTVRSQRYRILHGFVHGGQSLKADLDQSRVIQKHAVTLSENAYACGKTLDSLDLELEVSSLIQNGEEIDNPSGAVSLNEGDTLILNGSPRDIEKAEEWILLGNL